jgi:transposase
MVAPCSLDLRKRVVAAAAGGQSCRQIAKRFSVAASSVAKWTRRLRDTGSPAALPMGGKRPFKLAQHRDWVLARVAEKPDITLTELSAELQDCGVKVSVFAIWHFLRREGVSFKKKPARQRTGSRRRGAPPRAMEAPSRQDRCEAAGLH